MDTQSDQRDVENSWRGFPGGHARLPRISQPETPTEEPELLYVESAFLRDPRDSGGGAPAESGFEAYYSAESLFESVPILAAEPDPDAGPYAVLEVTPSASWEEVSRSHRTLVSQLHPDRYVDAEDTVREAAERRVRDVNEAFSAIRRQRAGRG